MKINNFFKDPYSIDIFVEKIPQKVRQFFKESILCYNNHIPNASTLMCKKTLIEICSNQNIKGKNLINRIENLNINKKNVNFLQNVPEINSRSMNSKPLPKMTVKKLIEISASIIEKIYL